MPTVLVQPVLSMYNDRTCQPTRVEISNECYTGYTTQYTSLYNVPSMKSRVLCGTISSV